MDHAHRGILRSHSQRWVVDYEDFMAIVDRFNREVKPDPTLYENLRQAAIEHIESIGFTLGKKLEKDEFVKGFAKKAVMEHDKRTRGEKSILSNLMTPSMMCLISTRMGW